jgi:integrase
MCRTPEGRHAGCQRRQAQGRRVMPRKSQTDNVRKICGCVKWKSCTHPWYLDFQRGKDERGRPVRWRDNLDNLIGRHCVDFTEAKDAPRRAINAKLEGRNPAGLLPADDPTLSDLLEAYNRERPGAPGRRRWQIPKIASIELPAPGGMRRFGDWRASAITTETLKQFRRLRPRVAGNRDLALIRGAFNSAVLSGLLPRSPFRMGDVPAIRFGREAARTRRLQPGEEERLLMHASRRLADLITAAIETGCRKGELLSLQWEQVRFTPSARIFLPAQKTKTKRDRRVPISSVLRRILETRRLDPAGDPLPPKAYVFGDATGRQIKAVRLSEWESCVLRAHGHEPQLEYRVRIKNGRRLRAGLLAAESRAVYAAVDLRFHDLRREAGSRWMEAGRSLKTIMQWLGHSNISQTSTYLGASEGNDEEDMRLYEISVGRLPALT